MKLTIIGVGQVLDFASGEMVDTMQVQAEGGEVFNIPAAQETVQELIRIVKGSGAQLVVPPPPRQDDPLGRQLQQAYQSAEGRSAQTVPQAQGDEDFPEGATVFGGDDGEIYYAEDGPEDSPQGMGDEELEQIFGGGGNGTQEVQVMSGRDLLASKMQRTGQPKNTSLNPRRNDGEDRSGVPSYSIAAVDEKGNPMLPPAPKGDEDDEEFDPGEQI